MRYKGYQIVPDPFSKGTYCIKKDGKTVLEDATLAGAKQWIDNQEQPHP